VTGAALYLGLISGTSADAIDAALVDFGGATPRLLAASATRYPDGLRAQLLALAQGDGATTLDALGALDEAVADAFADAADALLAAAGVAPKAIAAIGSHGQTIWHRPYAQRPFTFQIGDPNRITERTGCRVVADFRRRDLAAGGQGAPLMSAFHAAIFGNQHEDRAVLNLGGIANLTRLPASPDAPVLGFDTGPASCLLDAWAQRHLGTACDLDGAFAAQGRSDGDLLDVLLDEPYFALPAPKSTGREVFHLAWLDRHPRVGDLAPADVQATLVDLTARSVAEALRREAPDTATVFACGGGVHNPVLMQALAKSLAPTRLDTTSALGIDPDYVEAMGFAWLARETLAGRPGNLPSVTGARGLRVLGGIYAP
jgi:anhydro-N-acetylmuramic acid kinase